MSISNTTEDALINLIYRATAWANYADNAASTPETNIYVSLQTADPGDAGTMSTSETTYTSYGRQATARSTGWAASSGGSTSPVSNITFAAGTGGSGSVTFFSTGKGPVTGANAILLSGSVTPAIAVGNTVTPVLSTATFCSLD